MKQTINKAHFPFKSHFVDVYGSKLHYIEQGQGDPILFLHGIPTSSYVWRNVIPFLSELGHCIAPDLIGMGKSEKPDIAYTIHDHIKYIEKFIETLKLKNITLIMHGWGSIIGLDYAMRHPENCKGLVFYEAYLRSMNGDDVSLPYQEQVNSLQQENVFDLVTNSTYFIDNILPLSILRSLDEEEMAHYREPFEKTGGGKALAQYIREMPGALNKSEVDKVIAEYSQKLTKSKLPKLMLYSVPGFITTIATAMWAKDHLPNLEIVEVGEELHYAQESEPELVGESISIWLQGVEQNA